ILLELGITATFFICTGLVTRDERTLHRFGQWTGHPYKYLDPAQISDLRQAGMEIGAHTHSHRNLATLPRDEAKQELTLSKKLLEGLMQEPVRYLAYPYGKRGIHYTGETVGLLSECGYESAASIAFRRMRPGQRHSLF